MARFTAGPASATTISCRGSLGIDSSSASPPIGRRVMLRVPMPKRRAVRAWPYSCSSTQRKRSRTSVRLAVTAAVEPVRVQALQPTQPSRSRKVTWT